LIEAKAMDSREALKIDICAYFIANSDAKRDQLPQILGKLKDAAYRSIVVDSECMADRKTAKYLKDIGLKLGDEFYCAVSFNFSPKHYAPIAGFLARYEAINDAEIEAEYALEAVIDEEISDQWGRDEYDELGAPDFAVIIHSDCVEVRAYEKGVGDIIPKDGRKYIGNRDDVRWRYPLESLPRLKAMGRPVVKVEDLGR
jgi:hypothetical protein